MRTAMVVAWRELRERRLMFLGALLIGILTLATPLLPQTAALGSSPRGVITSYAFFIAVAFAVGGAFLAGLSLLGRDLVEARIGFYFSRPISTLELWSGKMIASLLLAAGTALLVLLPATLIGGGLVVIFTGGQWVPGWAGAGTGSMLLVGTLGVIMFLIVFGHYTGVIFRSHSPWLVLDLLGIPFLALLFWLALAPLLDALALGLFARSIAAGAVGLTIALLAGSFVGLAWGRIHLRRVHRALTVTVTCVLALFVAGYAAWGMWVRSPGPEDLNEISYVGSAQEEARWVVFSGSARGRGDYHPRFLADLEGDRVVRIGAGAWTPFELAANGSRIYWGELASLNPHRWDLMISRLGDEITPHATSISLTPSGSGALSADGSRIAVTDSNRLTIYDVETERSLLSIRLPEQKGYGYRLHFLGNDVLRVFRLGIHPRSQPGIRAHQVYEVSIRSRQLRPIGTLRAAGFRVSSRHDLIITGRSGAYTILRGSTPEPILDIAAMSGGVLPDGRLAFGVIEGADARLRLFSMAGEPLQTIDLGPGRGVMVGGHDGKGRLLVLTSPLERPSEFHEESTLLLVDPQSEEVRTVAERLVPAGSSWLEADIPHVRLFREQSGAKRRLVTFDADTGEKRIIAGRL